MECKQGLFELVDTANAKTTIPCPTPTCASNNEGSGNIVGTYIATQMGVGAVPNEDG